ncbi:MAG: hypothetical protein K2N98_02385 [Lachnospiraceae bacterium]|nr:hypothetical protein [Lachnospiraceae bacterium]
MKNGMKAGKLAVLLGAFGLMCTMTGCTKAGEKAEGQENEVIRIEASADENAAQNESGQQSDDGKQEQKDDQKEEEQKNDQKEDMKEETDSETMEQTPDESSQSQDGNELNGSVRSVGEDSMVVSKVYTYTTEDGNDVAVGYAEGGPDDELITVYFSEDTEYIVRTVKNGGVNGDSDVEDRSGTLSDIREGNSVLMNGSYEGEDFHAEQVIIYNFV